MPKTRLPRPGGLRPPRKPQIRWPLRKQRKKADLFVKFVRQVEKVLPGASGSEKKAWVKRTLDNLIVLPPIAEQISDLVIEIGTEIAYAGVQAALKDFGDPEELSAKVATANQFAEKYAAENKKLKAEVKKLKAEVKTLKE